MILKIRACERWPEPSDPYSAMVPWLPPATEVEAGCTLFRQGDRADSITIIADGLVKLVRHHCESARITIGLRPSGSALGMSAAFSGDRHPVSALAVVPSRIHVVSALELQRLIDANRDFARCAVDVMSLESLASVEDSARRLLPTSQQRFESLLESLSGGCGDAQSTALAQIETADLASVLSITEAETHAVISEWRRRARTSPRGCLGGGAFDVCDLLARNAVPIMPASSPDPDASEPSPEPAEVRRTVPSSDQRIDHLIAIVFEGYRRPNLTLNRISREVHLSASHSARLFRAVTGRTFRQFLNAVRVESARRALIESPLSIKEIAASVGYKHASDLTRRFRAIHGNSPAQYRLSRRRSMPMPPMGASLAETLARIAD